MSQSILRLPVASDKLLGNPDSAVVVVGIDKKTGKIAVIDAFGMSEGQVNRSMNRIAKYGSGVYGQKVAALPFIIEYSDGVLSQFGDADWQTAAIMEAISPADIIRRLAWSQFKRLVSPVQVADGFDIKSFPAGNKLDASLAKVMQVSKASTFMIRWAEQKPEKQSAK